MPRFKLISHVLWLTPCRSASSRCRLPTLNLLPVDTRLGGPGHHSVGAVLVWPGS